MKLANEGNSFEQAYFLTQHAMEFGEKFSTELRNSYYGTGFGVLASMKSNLTRIA